MRSFLFAVSTFAALFSRTVLAAACCGGTSSVPAIISGDDQYQLATSIARSEIIGDANANGTSIFRGPGTDEVTTTLRLDAALLTSDRTQANLSLPFVEKSITSGVRTGASHSLGDLSPGFTYEAWPEWSYSAWKPRGYLFTQLNVPIAHSIYDSQAQDTSDAVGSGFYRLAVGSLLLKSWRIWDASLAPEIHYSFARDFNEGTNPIRVRPGFGASVGGNLGYNLTRIPLRIGLRIQPVWNASRTVEQGIGTTRSLDQWVWNTGLDLSYAVATDWSLTGSYTDQTLFGPAINTTLSRTVALMLQRRWPR
jgi:hypothetical protein